MATTPASNQEPTKQFAAIIRKLFEERQKEYKAGRRQGHIWHFPDNDKEKDFSFTQARIVYGSYPELQRGELKNPPLRSVIMDLAGYLECTLTERNQLLQICSYALLPPYEQGDALETVLKIAEEVLRLTFWPSYVINRDWDIHIINEPVLKLIGISKADYFAIPDTMRNVIQMIFDPTLPIRQQLEETPDNWTYIAERNIFGFKYTNMFCEFEDWYQERIQRWINLPGFKDIWERVDINSNIAFDGDMSPFPFYKTIIKTKVGTVTFRSLLTSLGNYEYPQIVSYMPIGESSQAIYRELGIAIPSQVKTFR